MPGLRSNLEIERALRAPRVPSILRDGIRTVSLEEGSPPDPTDATRELARHFSRTSRLGPVRLVAGAGPRQRAVRAGVALSGGQAPGGHNVIAGLFDALVSLDRESRVVGFLGGPQGILDGRFREITEQELRAYRNSGGFDLIGAGRDKIETETQLAACRATCDRLRLDGLVIVGGDDSNTNAAWLAESFLEHGLAVSVVGVPKTIDGDLKGGPIEISFGFDTATRVYSELIGNIARDARSAGKYWHFIKLMGRSASHVTLECALATHPNLALIGEEVRARGMTLDQVVERIASVVRDRAGQGRFHGVCLIPEGLIEFVPEIGQLIAELNGILATARQGHGPAADPAEQEAILRGRLSKRSEHVYSSLPARIREQLLLERDSHGNVQVSKVDTELLLIGLVRDRLRESGAAGSFRVQGHFLGYEGRSAAPTNFDADYSYALGGVAAALVAHGRTGAMCCVGNLTAAPQDWVASGAPLTSLMHFEERKGKRVPVIAKALVRTDGEPFLSFAASRGGWELEDDYVYPGAIQYFGPAAVCDAPPATLLLERTGSSELPERFRQR